MYVYTHTYIHILFSSYKHIIIRTSTRTNIMSSIACDGTIDDPIPEYEVLATVNEDNGQKNYLVYGSAYFIDSANVYNRCIAWTNNDKKTLETLIQEKLPNLLLKTTKLKIHTLRPYAQFTIVTPSPKEALTVMQEINNKAKFEKGHHNLFVGNSTPLNLDIVLKASCKKFQVGDKVAFFSNRETKLGEGRNVANGEVVSLDKSTMSYVIKYQKFLPNQEKYVTSERNINTDSLWSPKKIKKTFSNSPKNKNNSTYNMYSGEMPMDLEEDDDGNSDNNNFKYNNNYTNNNGFNDIWEDVITMQLAIEKPRLQTASDRNKCLQDIVKLEELLSEKVETCEDYQQVCELGSKIAYLRWQWHASTKKR